MGSLSLNDHGGRGGEFTVDSGRENILVAIVVVVYDGRYSMDDDVDITAKFRKGKFKADQLEA